LCRLHALVSGFGARPKYHLASSNQLARSLARRSDSLRQSNGSCWPHDDEYRHEFESLAATGAGVWPRWLEADAADGSAPLAGSRLTASNWNAITCLQKSAGGPATTIDLITFDFFLQARTKTPPPPPLVSKARSLLTGVAVQTASRMPEPKGGSLFCPGRLVRFSSSRPRLAEDSIGDGASRRAKSPRERAAERSENERPPNERTNQLMSSL
jgi:hypothetical protein